MAFGQTAGKNQAAQITTLKIRFVAESKSSCREWLGSFLGGCQSFIVKVGEQQQLVKLLYQFHEEREEIRSEMLDYRVVHALKAVRDDECDESIKDMREIKGTEPNGNKVVIGKSALKMIKHAPALKHSERLLPCYVLEPRGL
ncbi:MAG TPA: hypothetical protein VKH81_16970 [Candidatus Angelobacter sp.]|nr:hypothetical protein [Candidatus Angelobacter sp.]